MGELLETVKVTHVTVQHPGMPFDRSGRPGALHLRVVPLLLSDPACFLVVFEWREGSISVVTQAASPAVVDTEDAQVVDRELQAQVAFLREELRRVGSEQVSTGEELQAANEEIQSTNEELQSTNEELESAKEELQSTNEELTSINAGLSDKLATLRVDNDELTELLAAVDIPVLLLSTELTIRRFSRAAGQLLNVIDGDVGRPFSHLRPTIELPDIDRLCAEVMGSQTTRALDVKSASGQPYSVSVRPYPVTPSDSVSSGVLLVFLAWSGQAASK
jgi:two-component system CheB/CheR fusion protein